VPTLDAAYLIAELIERIVKRFGPPPEPLAARAQEVSDALVRAGALFAELQTEIDARTALIDSLASKAQDAEGRAEDAIRRADLSEEQAKAVDAYLERALKSELAKVERSSRLREWGLAVVGGLVIGIASILISHFLFGY
jgi:predicted  nucleic acid-binding Zn-ribbon protein